MPIATDQTSATLTRKLDSTISRMEELYSYAQIIRSELEYSRSEHKTHTSAKSLIHELEN